MMFPDCRTSQSLHGNCETPREGFNCSLLNVLEQGMLLEPLKGHLLHIINFEKTLAWRFLDLHSVLCLTALPNSQLIHGSKWQVCEDFVSLVQLLLFYFQIYQFSEEKGLKGGGGSELKAGLAIKAGLKIVLLNHLIKMCYHVGTIEFNKIHKAITQSNPNGRRKI